VQIGHVTKAKTISIRCTRARRSGRRLTRTFRSERRSPAHGDPAALGSAAALRRKTRRSALQRASRGGAAGRRSVRVPKRQGADQGRRAGEVETAPLQPRDAVLAAAAASAASAAELAWAGIGVRNGAEGAGGAQAPGPQPRHCDPPHEPERAAARRGSCVPQAAVRGETPGAETGGGGGGGGDKPRGNVHRHQAGREPGEAGPGLGCARRGGRALVLRAFQGWGRLRRSNELGRVEAVAGQAGRCENP
jgi:hypothetical protein